MHRHLLQTFTAKLQSYNISNSILYLYQQKVKLAADRIGKSYYGISYSEKFGIREKLAKVWQVTYAATHIAVSIISKNLKSTKNWKKCRRSHLR